jgi:hypothetical protein
MLLLNQVKPTQKYTNSFIRLVIPSTVTELVSSALMRLTLIQGTELKSRLGIRYLLLPVSICYCKMKCGFNSK